MFTDGLDKFPISTVFVENLFMLLWIVTGTFICWISVPLIGWIYLTFGLSMVLCIMRILVCKNCYYHGKLCHTGWGKLSAIYCKQGELNHFGCGVSGKIIPIFYGSMALLPLIIGIISIINNFSVFRICILILFLFVVVMSSFTLRKKSCEICKMKLICPGSAAK